MVVATYSIGIVIALYAAYDDARTHLLRNVFTGPLALTAVIGFSAAAALEVSWPPLVPMTVGAVIFAGPWLLSHLISPASTGFGDVKYSAGLGLYLGYESLGTAFQGLLFATILGAAMAGGSLLLRRKSEALPFGPALVGGALLALTLAWLER